MNIPIVPVWVKLTIAAVIVAVVAGFGWYMKGIKDENVQLKRDMKSAIERIGNAEATNARQDEVFAQRDVQQNEVRSGVADVTVRIKQEAQHDPNTRTFNSTVLPVGLRNAILKNAERAAAECKGADCPNAD